MVRNFSPRIRALTCFLMTIVLAIGLGATALGVPSPAAAQEITINLGNGSVETAETKTTDGGETTANTGTQGLTERVIQMVVLITILSVAPSLLIMVTSFVRIVIVLSLLRTALGMQQSPPNMVMISLAVFLTGFVMAPVFTQSFENGVKPLIDNEIEASAALQEAAAPFRTFMLSQVREKDLAVFIDMSNEPRPATPEATPYKVLIPAFMISELRTGFEIGFLVFLPFLVIDLVIASILMSMGMMMLPPIIISLPFKIIFFVLVDGWGLIAGSLVASFQN